MNEVIYKNVQVIKYTEFYVLYLHFIFSWSVFETKQKYLFACKNIDQLLYDVVITPT